MQNQESKPRNSARSAAKMEGLSLEKCWRTNKS